MVAALDLTVCRRAGVPMECLAPGLCASTSGAPGAPSLPGQQPGRGGHGPGHRGEVAGYGARRSPCPAASVHHSEAKPGNPWLLHALRQRFPRSLFQEATMTEPLLPLGRAGVTLGHRTLCLREWLKCPRVGSCHTKETHFPEGMTV